MESPLCGCGSPRSAPNTRYCLKCKATMGRLWRMDNKPTAEQRKKANCRAYSRMLEKRGKIIRKPCEVCGDPEVQRHHDDYNDPWNVRYFCREHHLDMHGQRVQNELHDTKRQLIPIP